MAEQRPLVSVILAVYNEARSIEPCLASILSQDTPGFDLEILAIDGNSADGTPALLERLAAADARIKILNNPKRKAPFAFNIGLKEARGEYVCIFGSHTIYARDYISVCLNELLSRHAVACGGRVYTQPRHQTLSARLVAWALSHPFGSSRKSFRTQAEGPVDTVNYPVMRKHALIEAGGYDEELIRNQDNDMNQRLRARGHRILCTWKTSCFYHPSGSVRELLAYAARNGMWNAVSLRKNPASMGLRHFLPFLFVMSLACSSALAMFAAPRLRALGILALAGLLGIHLTAGIFSGLQVARREKSAGALCLPLVFLAFHCAYGLGTVRGFLLNWNSLQLSPEYPMTAKTPS